MDERPTPTPLAQLSTALLCMVVAQATEQHAPGGQGNAHLLLPSTGLALALVALSGRSLAPALFMGLLAGGAWAGQTPLVALAWAAGPVLGALLAYQCLTRHGHFDRDHPSVTTVGHALLWAYGMGAGAAALVVSACLVLAGSVAPAAWMGHFLQGWMGHALGALLLTPLVLSWRRTLRFPRPLRRVREGLLVWIFAAAAAVAVFGNTSHPRLAPLANAYWLFLPIAWSGVRLGLLSTTGLTGLIGLMALWGSYQRTGFFAQDMAINHGFGYVSYMAILSTVGLALAAWLTEHQRQNTALRIAAIAFDCQEGMLITDARGRILQANPSFLRLTGYQLPDIVGRTPGFLCAQPLAFSAQKNTQTRAHLLRANQTDFPAWITISPVHGSDHTISHRVISLQDITSLEEMEHEMAQQALAQRNTLVREVHHRIKNNLQGIVGMLRTLDHEHPQLHSAINQVLDRLHSIATIHGLQARGSSEAVRLDALLHAVAQGIAHHWSTPVQVHIAPQTRPWSVPPQEAVPLALVLSELTVNAVKHGGQASQDVQIHLRDLPGKQAACITLSNPGTWPVQSAPPAPGRGLDLVSALLPRAGAQLARRQAGERAVVTLELSPPTIHPEEQEHDHPLTIPPSPSFAGGR